MYTTTPPIKKYSMILRINEVTYKKRTTDVKKTILSLKPDFVQTDTYITLSTGTGANKISTDRKLNLVQGKKLFNDTDSLDMFVQNLLIEYS